MSVLTESIEERMQDLGLSFMAAGLESFFESQSHTDNTLAQSVADLLELEYLPRKERAAKSRLKLSGMPAVKRLEEFEIDWLKGGITARQVAELSTLAFIERKENVVLMGPSDLGKTHLMLALAHKACMTEYTVWYTSCWKWQVVSTPIRKLNLTQVEKNYSSLLFWILYDSPRRENVCA